MGIEVKLAFDLLAFISVMVLIVLGLGIIASMMGIFNFAHGEFVLLGAYTVYLFESSGLSACGSASWPRRSSLALVGLVLERIDHPAVLRRADHRDAGHLRDRTGHPRDRARALRRPLQVDLRAARPACSRSVGIDFSIWRTVIMLTTIVRHAGELAVSVRARRSDCGSAARSKIPMLARACGISTSRLYALTFAFGSALAGLAGALIVPLYQLSADIGMRFLVQAFLSVMLGGVGTFEGPVLGAAAVGGMAAGLPWVVHSGAGRSAGVRDRAC